jgi:hypothetical protein
MTECGAAGLSTGETGNNNDDHARDSQGSNVLHFNNVHFKDQSP